MESRTDTIRGSDNKRFDFGTYKKIFQNRSKL